MSKSTTKTGKATGRTTTKQTVKGRQQVQAVEAAQVAAPAPAVVAKPKAKTAKPAPAVQTITVAKTDKKFEGARAAWYAALVQHDGKSTEDFVAACSKQPPAMPKSGKAEDPRGWLRYFARERVAVLS